MEKTSRAVTRVWFLCGFLVASLLLCGAHAGHYLYLSAAASDRKSNERIKQVTDPTGNVNLSPFEQWRSAYECLQNISTSCLDKFTLNETGWLNLTAAEKDSFCSLGCAQHTYAVLTCIDLVKRDYKFINKATVQDLRNYIAYGCDYGFDGTTIVTSNARRMSKSKTIFFVSILSTLVFLNLLSA
ncbi:hypothetical protein QYF36_014018 [Acer negundo]|nr:hypothetical protein QYF36_014018 [Acer negundo]